MKLGQRYCSDCDRLHYARGRCKRHYNAWHKSVDFKLSPKPTVEQRFWAKVDFNGPVMPNMDTPCWVWTGSVIPRGYGNFKFQGRSRLAHCVAYLLENSSIPSGFEIDHQCHNKTCVNLHHFRLVTSKQNSENRTGAQKNNLSSGIRGVYLNVRTQRWYARVGHNGRLINVGTFNTIEDAAEAVRLKRIELFTHNDADRRLLSS